MQPTTMGQLHKAPVVLLLTALAANVYYSCLAEEQRDFQDASGCSRRIVAGREQKWVCICDEDFCDELIFSWPRQAGQAVQVTSSRSGKRFHSSGLKVSNQISAEARQKLSRPTVRLNVSQEYQQILGWGGAFTDSACINIQNLTKEMSSELMDSYYGENGLQYNFGRVPLGGTDFSTRKYTYNDNASGDYQQEQWSLASEDLDSKIPIIKEAQELCRSRGIRLKLFASPWSAPAWMKTSQNIVRGSLLDEDRIYRSYTEYLMKFYRAYRRRGINFWGATVQNEPFVSTLLFYNFNGMSFKVQQMIKLIGQHLGPALAAEGMGPDTFKLMLGDDSLGLIDQPVVQILDDPSVRRHISGLAFHWYTSGGSLKSYDRLTNLYEQVKDKVDFMMMTEACNGFLPLTAKVDLGSWDRGEAYAFDIIQDLLRQTSAWIDWNLALDPQGGPNWANNFVDSAIIVDAPRNRFIKQPMYYVLAHFTRFLPAGSVRIQSELDGFRDSLQVIAATVVNPRSGGRHLVVNILNRSEYDFLIDILLDHHQKQLEFSAVSIEAKSINSIILKL